MTPGGSLFLFNRRVLRFFRRDGHNWRKKRDGRTVGEAHELLKVGNVAALNCYYAHGEQNPTFQRRTYWILDPAYEHIVLVHYRDISKGKPSSGPGAQFSPGSSSTFSHNPSSYSTQNPTSILCDSYEPCQSVSSPGSVEVTSDIYIGKNGMSHLDGADAESGTSTGLEVTQALRRLEEQLSLNEENLTPLYSEHETAHDSNPQQNQGGKPSSGPGAQLSPGSSSTFSQNPSSYSTQNPGSTSILGDSYEPYQSFSIPGSVEVTFDIYIEKNGMSHLDGTDAGSGTSTRLEVTQALRRLEEQLSLNEENLTPLYSEHETAHDSNPQQNQGVITQTRLENTPSLIFRTQTRPD